MTVYENFGTSIDELADTSECECADCGHGRVAAEVYEVTPVPSGSRPPIRSSAALRNAWREYRCATNRMVQLRVFGKWNTPVNPKTVDAWRALESTLTAAGYDVHRAWVYVCRNIAGQKAASLHAYGLAIDIDHAGPRCNVNNPTPDRRKVRFSTAATKLERCRDVQRGVADTAFTPEQVAAVEAIRTVDGYQVFAWGGRWPTTKDTMHFQINVTPQELARGVAPETVGNATSVAESDESVAFELEQLALSEGPDDEDVRFDDAMEGWFEGEEESDGWTGSPDQVAFRDRVLAAHLAQSKDAKHAPFPDRGRGELREIPGRGFHPARHGQSSGAPHRGSQCGPGGGPGARRPGCAAHEENHSDKWLPVVGPPAQALVRALCQVLQPIPGHSGQSAGRPASDAALAYMLRRKDKGGFRRPGPDCRARLQQPRERHCGRFVSGSDAQSAEQHGRHKIRARWRATWFYKWLTNEGNGRRFGFKQLPTEEWHWEYQREPAGRRQEVPASGESSASGQQWIYRSRVAGTTSCGVRAGRGARPRTD